MKRDERTEIERLLSVTKGCRNDMHEPDEQEVKVRVVGDHLDNACGVAITPDAIAGGFQEFVVCIEQFRDGKIYSERFNLANLIAMARGTWREPT